MKMALSSMGSFAFAAALRSVTLCLVNPGRRVKVGGLFSLLRIFAGETNDATNVRSKREATMKWMGCPVITEQRMEQSKARLPAFTLSF